MDEKIVLEIKTPRTGLETPESMAQMFTSLASIKSPSLLFKKTEIPLCFEILTIHQTLHFLAVVPVNYQSFVESQILSQYPKAIITTSKDPLQEVDLTSKVNFGQMKLQHNYIYPLKIYKDFADVDPLSSLLGILSKLEMDDVALVQFVLVPSGSGWQGAGRRAIEQKGKPVKEGEVKSDPFGLQTYQTQITDKIAFPGFKIGIRLLVKSNNSALLGLIGATFTSFNNPNGNSMGLEKPSFWQKGGMLRAIIDRSASFVPKYQYLNILEVATLYHFPSEKLINIPNITWSKTILSEPPENLPVAINFNEEAKKQVNFFAKTDYKGKPTTFGILKNDRRRHVYIIGKTGTGKSTMLMNMAINDIRNGEGVGVIDPHGETAETLLEFVPSYRVNDVIYFNPSDTDYPFHLNPLEITDPSQKDIIASGIVAIFYKLFAQSWGPRLEYILRNTILTLLEVPNSTLLQIPELLTNAHFRNKAVDQITDPVVKAFWKNEFDKMSENFRNEAVSPILNKVGQFLSSQIIRNIVGHPKSTINLEDIMNNKKILILNLSQGRMGEDNAALLGAMLITKLQLAAMHRVNIPEEEREDFYLYVDEFQNFATTSFIKILSEARKYKLNLILANQYIKQVDETIRAAIFGNVGTMMTFLIGAEDADLIAKEFSERFKPEDLLALGNFQIIIKMAINNLTSTPFFAQSLPLPQSRTQSKDKVIKVSRERYARPVPSALPSSPQSPLLPQSNKPVEIRDTAHLKQPVSNPQSPQRSRNPQHGDNQHPRNNQGGKPQQSQPTQQPNKPLEIRDTARPQNAQQSQPILRPQSPLSPQPSQHSTQPQTVFNAAVVKTQTTPLEVVK
ncbi:MAG: hypothetical protein A3D24_03495 [Candidatus Blackburnbacteria bacterium RIFCSPHIGHO2_02_FULL_39_13]|uniref:Uncharacterized protein n=1 Tax=Candidatus Blackburnbacteria bacterium RIFCSPLOWO2_01_FULL_40_20 TaxID=1797519 RepID=A0A1G1VDD1_9BACT|nr:MAG: hypothetical protein A2694_02165 [Candidatus Blackburnbacteria bacterium RIFCSPHIGHO2_01_FULL_40_17]OGY08156.1 MAG: hypothetical protein A3D24_03495 [Candidatus Blackburnbacteria bacterium RIFCSPHIGHO2_02_FULL_39_13]OGY13424.1 MAG: hypothetical protein A3A77_04615 [Candidatus Blackburnbacteria bacterium RIFCSPLOWO2_01_FULL_40_20]